MKKNSHIPTAVETSKSMIATTSVNHGLTSVVTNMIAASTMNRMYQTTVTTLHEISIQINTMNDAASRDGFVVQQMGHEGSRRAAHYYDREQVAARNYEERDQTDEYVNE